MFTSFENPCHATSRRHSIFLFVFIYHTMRDARNARQTVCKRRKNGRGKRQLQWFGFTQTSWKNFFLARIPSGSWICLKHMNEINRNSKRCWCPFSWGHSPKLAKIPIPNRLYQVFDQVGKSFSNYKPGTNWRTKCKVEADKKFKEHGKYIPRKRKTYNKQKVAEFLTLFFCQLSLYKLKLKYINNEENAIYRVPMIH